MNSESAELYKNVFTLFHRLKQKPGHLTGFMAMRMCKQKFICYVFVYLA